MPANFEILVKQFGKVHLRMPTDKASTDDCSVAECEARDKAIEDKAKQCESMTNGYFECQVIDPKTGAEFDHWILIR